MPEMNKDEVGRIIAIRYKGKLYDHYGILDGYSNVIHVHKKKGMITVDPLDRVLKNVKKITYIDDDFDVRWNQYEHALALVGSKHQYRFFTDNCECWVQKIRTGRAFSKQVDDMSGTIAAIVLGVSAVIGFSNVFSATNDE